MEVLLNQAPERDSVSINAEEQIPKYEKLVYNPLQSDDSIFFSLGAQKHTPIRKSEFVKRDAAHSYSNLETIGRATQLNIRKQRSGSFEQENIEELL